MIGLIKNAPERLFGRPLSLSVSFSGADNQMKKRCHCKVRLLPTCRILTAFCPLILFQPITKGTTITTTKIAIKQNNLKEQFIEHKY